MVLGAILLARPAEMAREAGTYPGYNSAQLRARVQERRYALSGGGLLMTGFSLQLVAYAWSFSAWWLIVYGLAVSVVAGWLALQLAKRFTATFDARADELMRKAVE
jgi:hypothetical protein